jgi:hypothetical protein
VLSRSRGFRVENLTTGANLEALDPQLPFSFINLAFDQRGRLLVSQESNRGKNGPIVLCSERDDKGAFRKLTPYCEQVTNCHGMCWIGDALYLVGHGPQGAGLYRCTERKSGDAIEKVELLHKFEGGMGEHGPHAVLHGPDGKLYLVLGNHSWVKTDKLASNSPLRRWPTGGQGPDQGKEGSTEDVLLPRLNDANGHAANLRAPGGTI